MKRPFIAKAISIISRGGNRFFDQALASYGIGCGQQFFLWQIAEHEGITMCDLAILGHFDKTTVTRAVQKLVETGYVVCQTDEHDRRIRHLYVTDNARQLLKQLPSLQEKWENILMNHLTQEEITTLITLLEKVADNALQFQKEGEI